MAWLNLCFVCVLSSNISCVFHLRQLLSVLCLVDKVQREERVRSVSLRLSPKLPTSICRPGAPERRAWRGENTDHTTRWCTSVQLTATSKIGNHIVVKGCWSLQQLVISLACIRFQCHLPAIRWRHADPWPSPVSISLTNTGGQDEGDHYQAALQIQVAAHDRCQVWVRLVWNVVSQSNLNAFVILLDYFTIEHWKYCTL